MKKLICKVILIFYTDNYDVTIFQIKPKFNIK